jgi:hypothetical protein
LSQALDETDEWFRDMAELEALNKQFIAMREARWRRLLGL